MLAITSYTPRYEKRTENGTRGLVYDFVSDGQTNISLVYFVGGIVGVDTSADGPNLGRGETTLGNRGHKTEIENLKPEVT